MLVKLGLGLPDGFGLLHHSRFVGILLGEKIVHLSMQSPKLPVELPRPLSGFVDDPVDRPSSLIIQTELLGVLFDETGRSGAAVGSATPLVPPKGGLGKACAGDDQPGHE
ncbi:unnamed protein product, partial [marine sediment metagenome]